MNRTVIRKRTRRLECKRELSAGRKNPQSNPVVSDVDVCAIESVFIHVTVVPTAIFRSSGANALFPSAAAPTGIAIDDPDAPVVGVGKGVGDGALGGVE